MLRTSTGERIDLGTLFRIASRLVVRKWRQSPFGRHATLGEELARSGHDFQSWWRKRVGATRQYSELLRETDVDALKAFCPAEVDATLKSAAMILRHEFEHLGSGVYKSEDPDRPERSNGYRPIDWYLDPVRNVRFPQRVPYKEWKLYEMRPKDADVKFPWELGRCQHFASLGQAWRLTREPRYAAEIVDEIDDFMEANPVGFGVNWTCTMDIALRAANWVVSLAMIKDCGAIPQDRFHAAYSAVFEHGRFIFANFENTYEVTSNHYLSNLVGLHFISAEFLDIASGRAWDMYCRRSLETEIGIQILPDGADFESSVPYHRLVTELFLGSYRLAQLQGRPLSEAYASRLRDMVAYLTGVMRPDRLMPVLGDADDGRLTIFTDYAGWRRQDATHILAPAGHTLCEPSWLGLADQRGHWEAAWWGFPLMQKPAAPAVLPDHVTLYPHAGAFVARNGGTYLIVTNAKVGTEGFGNHKHNDQLSFELHVGGEPLIVDPGSYVYTSDFTARNQFRSTAIHSTLSIDGVEQNEINPEWLFRMFEKADPEHLSHGVKDGVATYVGRHVGYRRLEKPVTHERQFDLTLATGHLIIEDRLEGEGEHELTWHFQLAPGVSVQTPSRGSAVVRTHAGHRFDLSYSDVLEITVGESFYSPSYGVRIQAPMIRLRHRADVAKASNWKFVVSPVADSSERTRRTT